MIFERLCSTIDGSLWLRESFTRVMKALIDGGVFGGSSHDVHDPFARDVDRPSVLHGSQTRRYSEGLCCRFFTRMKVIPAITRSNDN